MPPVLKSNLGAVSFARSRASVSLDAMRATAALLVLSDHLRYTFFVEYHELLHHRLALLIPYLITSTGTQAVTIFFVLSGYLVGGSVIRALERDTWSWKLYLTHRLIRLWLVLLPALCLVVLWDFLNIALQHYLPSYGGVVMHRILGPHMAQTLTPSLFFANVAFLQRIPFPFFFGHTLLPTLGSDGALWSLTNEFWYYILFPLGLFALRPHYRPLQRVLLAIGFVVLACFVGKSIFLMFPAWLCGALLLFLPRPGFRLGVRIAATAIYIPVFLGLSAIQHQHSQLSFYGLSIVTAAYIWTLLSASTQPSSKGIWEFFARGLARFSYTLYLVHMPMLYFLAGFLVHNAAWQPTPLRFLIAGALACLIVLYALVVASLTEFHLEPVRRWIETRVVFSTSA